MTDEELRDRFERLREHDAQGVPPFARVFSRAAERVGRPASHRVRRLALAGTGLLAVAAGALFLILRRPEPMTDLANWRSPTEFLLQVPAPGNAILREIPRLGAPRIGQNP